MKTNQYEAFRKYQVCANSLVEFLEKYTKPSAHALRGTDYVTNRIKSHQEDIAKYGFTFITHHDSITGENVSFYPNEK